MEIKKGASPFEKIITLNVEKKWYGNISNSTQIVTDVEECGNAFELNKKFLVFTVDENMVITYFNNAAERITGISKEAAVGEHCYDVLKSNICEKTCPLRCSFTTDEEIIDKHPKVAECAVVGVKSEFGEEDVMAFVVPAVSSKSSPLTCEELIGFCEKEMTYYMVPRYIELRESLPKTENQKTKKKELKERGVTDKTWDRKGSIKRP